MAKKYKPADKATAKLVRDFWDFGVANDQSRAAAE